MSTPPSEATPRRLRFTLHGDGGSDRVLLPIIAWVLRQHDPIRVWERQWADLSRLRRRPEGLRDCLRRAVELYPCDALFVHRDQERGDAAERVREILGAAGDLSLPVVPIVPIRMTEAWLLFDERAIRQSAGNPSGVVPLRLPAIDMLESEPDPKAVLLDRIRVASGATGRRLDKVRPEARRHQLAELIVDYAPLRRLSAFVAFERDTLAIISSLAGAPSAG